MYYLNKRIKYSAINFNKDLKRTVTYNLRWIDSTYDVYVCEKLSKLDGTVIRERQYQQERVSMFQLNKHLETMKDIDMSHGYYVNMKGDNYERNSIKECIA